MTAKALKNMFPKLQNNVQIHELPLNVQHSIPQKFENSLINYKVTLFDANHIIGSAMFLVESPFGTFFHTGDFRFDEYMFQENSVLYPNLENYAIGKIPKSIHIDELWLDNTYCDPIFRFPKRDQCVKDIVKIIEENLPNLDVHIGTYTLGKEEILVEVAKKFETKVVVNYERYKNIVTMGFQTEYFTIDPEGCWIFCLKQKDIEKQPER
jgi:DNA cross-link repair 1B protein